MKNSKILTAPHPFLKAKTKKIVFFNDSLKSQIMTMLKVLRQEGGIGLAANQVGLDNRTILVEFKDPDKKENIPLMIMCNPQIIQQSKETIILEEGCLSTPNIELEVMRPKNLKMRYQDLNGRQKKIAPKGILARVVQHEVDHLDGVLFTKRSQEQLFSQAPILKNFKILFMGSGEFAAVILNGLILIGFELDIVTEKTKAAGRNQKTKLTAVAQIANQFGKKYWEIENLSRDFPTELNKKYHLLICADFGHKIPNSILKQAKIAALNIHPSLLPLYRGSSPIQTALLGGANETGITIIRMSAQIDAGPLLARAKNEIFPSDNYLTLRDRLATLGLKLLIKILPDIALGRLREVSQNEKNASKTKKFSKEDGQINWKKSAKTIERQIRAFYPWPSSYTFIDNKRLIILKAHLEKNKLVLDLVQPEGKTPMKFSQFIRGFRGKRPKWFISHLSRCSGLNGIL